MPRNERHSLASLKFNPSYHTPGFSNLPALQYRLECARKARLSLVLEASQLGQAGTSQLETPNIGSTKLRNSEVRYSWKKTSSSGPVQDPGPIFDGAQAGALRIHQYTGGSQVWVLDRVKAGTKNRLHWTVATNGHPHPALETHFLQLDEKKTPTWVTRGTITSYTSRRKKAAEKKAGNADEALGPDPNAPVSSRVRRFRLGAQAGNA